MNAINFLKQQKELHNYKVSSSKLPLHKEINSEAKDISKIMDSNWILNILKLNHNNSLQF